MKNYLKHTSLGAQFRRFGSAGLVLSLFSGQLFAASTNLAWDASTSSNVAGYIVSVGTSSGNYTSNYDVGNKTTYALSGLTEGTKYYAAVKAYDSAKTTESTYSNEVNWTVPVATALTATFTPLDPISIEQGKSITFTDTTTGTVLSRAWNLPGSNATTSTAQSVTVSYPSTGTYSASLTVTGSSGSVTTTKPITVTASATTSTTPTTTTTTTPTTTTTTTPTTTSSNGLVAAFGFEETDGATVADASGNGNHGTIKEALRIDTGKYGKALNFDGINDWVTVNDSDSLDLTIGMTIEAWVYPTVPMNNWTTVVMKEQSGQQVYTLTANSGSNQPSMIPWINGGQKILSGGPQLTPGQWWHLAATYDGQNERLYVNGIQVAVNAQTGDILTSTGALRIGGNSIWGEFFKGYIDEVRIYNRALSATEVSNDLKTPVSATSAQLQLIMGNKNEEPWIDYQRMGRAEAYQVVAAKSGSVTEVQVYLDASTTTATQLDAGVYTENNGHAGTLIAQGTLGTLKPGWNRVTIPSAAVTAGQKYWFAVLGVDGDIGFLDQMGSGTGIMERSSSRYLTSLPATWTASWYGHSTNASMSIYANGN